MTEEKFRGLMNVVMMSPDIFGCFKASATQLTLLRVDVRLFMAAVEVWLVLGCRTTL